jgi:F0F1-type ATP synthase epsilon subunit
MTTNDWIFVAVLVATIPAHCAIWAQCNLDKARTHEYLELAREKMNDAKKMREVAKQRMRIANERMERALRREQQ